MWFFSKPFLISFFKSLLALIPQGNVIPNQLQNHRTILVILLINSIDICNSLLKRSISQLQCFLRLILLLIQENRHIKMQTQPDWIGLRQVWPRQVISLFIARSGHVSIVVVATEFAQVSVVVAFEFQIENFRLYWLDLAFGRQDLLVDDLDDSLAVFLQLVDDLLPVVVDDLWDACRVFGLFLQGVQHLDLSSEIGNDVLVCWRTEVSFCVGQLVLRNEQFIDVIYHVVISLSLLG